MKKIIALSLAFAAFTLSASAQEPTKTPTDKSFKQHKHGKHGGHKEMMKDINLSDAQKSQLKSIREDKTLSREDKKAKMQGVFTADQKKQLTQNKANMQAKRKEMQDKRAAEMKTKLGLSNDQEAKLRSQQDATRAQMKAVKEDKSLSADAKKAKIKSLKDAAKEQRKSVLTADQQKKWDEMKKDSRGKHRSEDKSAK